MRDKLLCLGFISALAVSGPVYAGSRISFSPSKTEIANPERGFWTSATEDFARVVPADLGAIRNSGITVIYAVVRLDDYRDQPIDDKKLQDINKAFGAVRDAGLKVILRFTYNYPATSSDYESAKDAPWPVVKDHITQLAPVVNRNKDVLVVFQAGFFGAWGEQHTSSNKLDTPEAKLKLREALYAALDPSIAVQWRYPGDIMSWRANMLLDQIQRTAFHNDCFLSSPTDVGTYAEMPAIRRYERAAMKQLTASTYFSGEVCDAQKDQVRSDCQSILKEGAEFHLSGLNLDYYIAFHKRWRKQGCFKEVARKMGYRFVLNSAERNGQAFALEIANDGWAKLYKPRNLKVTTDSVELNAISSVDLASIGPGGSAKFQYNTQNITFPARVCVSAPDPEATLAKDARYAIKFANKLLYGQVYGPEGTGICFTVD